MQPNTTQTKSHTVPVDLLMDVLTILFNNDIPFHVEGINEHENSLIIKTNTSAKQIRHKKALENIKELTADYTYYRYESDSGINDMDYLRDRMNN